MTWRPGMPGAFSMLQKLSEDDSPGARIFERRSLPGGRNGTDAESIGGKRAAVERLDASSAACVLAGGPGRSCNRARQRGSKGPAGAKLAGGGDSGPCGAGQIARFEESESRRRGDGS